MRYQAVVFDLFFTLISLQAVGAEGPAEPELLKVPREQWDPAWLRYEDDRARGRLRSTEEVLACTCRDLGLPHDPACWADIAAGRRARFRKACLLYTSPSPRDS